MTSDPYDRTPPNRHTGPRPPASPQPRPGSGWPARTPEDGRRIHTPEGGAPITTRED